MLWQIQGALLVQSHQQSDVLVKDHSRFILTGESSNGWWFPCLGLLILLLGERSDRIILCGHQSGKKSCQNPLSLYLLTSSLPL